MDQKKAGVLLSYGQTILSTIISLVYTPVMLRLLGQSEYGTYTLVNGFISNLSLMSFGLGSAYVRYYARAKVQEGEEGVGRVNGMFMTIFLVISAMSLLVGGVALIWLERRRREVRHEETERLPWLTALGIGLAQCVAMIPGVSRSAATILGALGLGTSRKVAVEYSFFLAIPTMFAASAYSLLKEGGAMTAEQWVATAVGFVTAFLVALAVIAFLMSFIRRRDFQAFGWYRIALAVVLLAWLALRG